MTESNSENSRAVIEQKLNSLIGVPLTDLWRSGTQIFEFGEQKEFLNRRGQIATRGDFSLHVETCWEVRLGARSVVSNFEPTGESRCEQSASTFFQLLSSAELIVQKVELKDDGGLIFIMSHGVSLLVNPAEEDQNRWRLFGPAAFGELIVDLVAVRSWKSD